MNKDQLKIKLQALPFFRGDIDLKFIEGFMTNDSYIAIDDNNRYIVKIGGNKYYGVTRSHEIKASQAGYRAGVSPKVIYYLEEVLIFEYIKSKSLTPQEIREEQNLKKIINLIKIVHKKVFNYLKTLNLSLNIFQII